MERLDKNVLINKQGLLCKKTAHREASVCGVSFRGDPLHAAYTMKGRELYTQRPGEGSISLVIDHLQNV